MVMFQLSSLQGVYYIPQVHRRQMDGDCWSSNCVAKWPRWAQDTTDSLQVWGSG